MCIRDSLYTFYSIDTGKKYSRGFHSVALQEMGHLMSVQNLLLSVKSTPYFARQDASPQPDQDPFPFSLVKLTKPQLAKFVSAEMPALSSITSEEDRELATQALSLAQFEVGTDINRVGLIYARIYWLFQSSDEAEGPLKFNEEDIKWLKSVGVNRHVKDSDLENPALLIESQASSNDWGYAADIKVLKPTNRIEILNAIHELLVEGEGHTDNSDSHFSTFFDLYKKWDKAISTNRLTVQNLPANPTSSTYPVDHIASPYSELFDIRYKLMLLDFHHWLAFKNNSDEAESRNLFASWAISEMKIGVRGIFKALMTKEFLNETTDEMVKCAPFFSLPVQPFPVELSESIDLMEELVGQSNVKILEIQSHANATSSDRVVLETIKTKDLKRIEFASGSNFMGS